MTKDEFVAVLRTEPFRPFKIYYRTGDVYRVPTSDSAWTPPVGDLTRLFVADHKGSFNILDITWIDRIEFATRGGSTRRRKAG